MKTCPHCHTHFDHADWNCPACGFHPPGDPFPLFAPDQADNGFEADLFRVLYASERGHFWFEGRNRLIAWALERYGRPTPGMSFLEIGCGTGFVLQGLAQHFPDLRLYGSELFPEGLAFAAQRLPHAELFQMDARRIPYENEFDAIAAFDVIEHIPEDETVLGQMARALKPGGLLLLTVPQHRFLWSSFDTLSHHQRRYSRAELITKVQAAGFQVQRVTSFVSLPFPLMLLDRLKERLLPPRAPRQPEAEFQVHPAVNRLLAGLLWAESGLIRAGVSLPFGGSLLLVGQKQI